LSVRWLGLCLLAYAPHLLEEHLTGMHDDPLIVLAFDHAMAGLPAREAAYLVFQLMMIVMLTAAYLVGLGGRWRDAVMTVLALSLLAESHHLVRALTTLEYNAGALTSLPMPVLGAAILWTLLRRSTPKAPDEAPRVLRLALPTFD
jgi:hypothetical protein